MPDFVGAICNHVIYGHHYVGYVCIVHDHSRTIYIIYKTKQQTGGWKRLYFYLNRPWTLKHPLNKSKRSIWWCNNTKLDEPLIRHCPLQPWVVFGATSNRVLLQVTLTKNIIVRYTHGGPPL